MNTLLRGSTMIAIVGCVFSAGIQAQESRGTIVGRVTDPSGAAIPAANIEVTSRAQGVKQSFTTNESGLYQAPYLIPGTYEVAVSVTGFKRAVQAVQVDVGGRVGADFTLEVGDAATSIDVTDQAPLLSTETASSGQVVDTKRIAELPMAHGQPLQLMGLASGVAYTGSATLDRPYEPTHIAAFAVNGTRANRSDITIDGIPSTATANANEVTASYVPPQDMVQEFKVQTATFDAQFGNTEGGVTNISIKSGTNQFHGSGYYYKQAPALFANNWFANAQNQARTDFDYDRWGGSFGGPVILPKLYDGRNRTFFMYGPEGFKDSRPRNNGTPTTLTDANKMGDFSAQLAGGGSSYQIFDPLTRRETAPGVYTGDPFPNNIIPANRINPVTKNLLQYWPSPLSQGDSVGRNNFQNPNLLEVTDYFNHTLRLDHNLTDSQRLAFRWSSYDRDSNYNNYFGNLATGENFQFVSRAASLDYVKVLNPSTVLNVRYGYNRFIRVTANNPEADGFDLVSLGFPQAYVSQISQDEWKFPRMDITGYQGTGIGGEFRPNDTHSLIATVNRTMGSHAVKFGTEFRSYRENALFDPNEAIGRFEFDTNYTRQSNTSAGAPNGIAQSAAAFLLGLPTRATVNRQSSYAEQSTSWGFFLHDDWRVTDRLTLNIGLRYEFETPLEERFGRSLATFDPNATVMVNGRPFRGAFTVGEPGQGLFSTPKNLLMPRFGFAYRLGDRTVVRGGYGIYYGFLGQRRGDVIRAGFSRTTEINASPNGGLSFTRDLTNVFTEPVLEPRSGNEIPPTLVGTGNTAFFNPNPATPQNQRWQLGVQRELGGNWLSEVAYVGNRGTRLEITRDINTLPLQYLSTSPTRDQANINYLNAQVDNPFAGQLQVVGGLNNPRISRAQSLRPFPYYSDLTTSTNQGYSWYHSMQASVQKRFSQGYTVLLSYTYSKFMEAVTYLNPADPMPPEMISPFDRPHRLSMSALYELPFGRGKAFLDTANPVLSRIVGGWQLNGIYTYQSGAPIDFSNNNIAFNGNFSDIALSNPTRERWINTDAGFQRQASQILEQNVRTFPRWISSVRGHRLSNIDLSVIKNTAITEAVRVQFRGEALNAFNSPHFAGPEANPTSANFGVVTGVLNYARRIQLGARVVF
jgi:hypothetical protein